MIVVCRTLPRRQRYSSPPWCSRTRVDSEGLVEAYAGTVCHHRSTRHAEPWSDNHAKSFRAWLATAAVARGAHRHHIAPATQEDAQRTLQRDANAPCYKRMCRPGTRWSVWRQARAYCPRSGEEEASRNVLRWRPAGERCPQEAPAPCMEGVCHAPGVTTETRRTDSVGDSSRHRYAKSGHTTLAHW